MIIGNPKKFALYFEKASYIEAMNDFDCFCGYFLNGKKFVDDNSTTMLFTQKQSILFGALANIIDAEDYFHMPLADCFIEMLQLRFFNHIAESEEEYIDKEWLDRPEDLRFSAELESSIFGIKHFKLFCIGHDSSVRIITYKRQVSYFSIKNLDHYCLDEVIVSKDDLREIIEQVKFGEFNLDESL